MKKVICHQYATGRGKTGYGYEALSKEKDTDQNASFPFSLNKKSVGLRFSRLSAGTEYVLEIGPVSADYHYAGVFYTGKRIEAGSSSIYTHVLIFDVDQIDEHNPSGLLKKENFLTPEEFSEITYGRKHLKIVEKENADLPREEWEPDSTQRAILGEFLARYWKLLEQREWYGKNEEVALILPGKTIQAMINFFSYEVVSRLPELLRPAISVSFGTQWGNRGPNPSVCYVLPDMTDNPFPFYNLVEGQTGTRKAEAVEEKIGQLLLQGKQEVLPETYQRITRLGAADEKFRKLARSYTTIAHCVNADLETTDGENQAEKKKQAYEKLIELAGKRYGIGKERAQYAFLPLLLGTFRAINKKKTATAEEKKWMILESMSLHLSNETGREALDEFDKAAAEAFHNLKPDDMVTILQDIWSSLKENGKTANECFALVKLFEQELLGKHMDPVYDANASVLSALQQCSRLTGEVGDTAISITSEYGEWLRNPQNRDALLTALRKWQNVEKINNNLFFSLIKGIEVNECASEKDLISYLNILRCARKKDPTRAINIWHDTFPAVLNNANNLKIVSDESFDKIADYILGQTLTRETIVPAVNFVIAHPKAAKSAGYLDQIMEKILQDNLVNIPEIQDVLFEKLEEAADYSSVEKHVEKLLEKSGGRIPGELARCKITEGKRLQKGIEAFVHAAGIKSKPDMQREWNCLYSGKYACSWDELTEEQLSQPVIRKFQTSYAGSQNKIDFLHTYWAAANADGPKENGYGNLLKKAVIGVIERDYDILWKQEGKDPAGRDTVICRNALDQIIDSSDSTELKEKCANTEAGKARSFLNRLHELDYNGLPLTASGELLREYRGHRIYTDYIKINQGFFKSRMVDPERKLIESLFRTMSVSYDSDFEYWEGALGELGFLFAQDWKNNDRFRMLNILSFVTQTLEEISVPELLTDLQDFCSQYGYRANLWNKTVDEKYFCGNGQQLLTESLCKWLEI